MERIDLTFYNNRFSIYRYIFSHMWNFCSKKPVKEYIKYLGSDCYIPDDLKIIE